VEIYYSNLSILSKQNTLKLNTVFEGKCQDAMRYIPDNSIDMVLSDIPHGMGIYNEWDIPIDLPEYWKELNRITKSKGAMVFTASQPYTSTMVVSNMKNFRYDYMWIMGQSSHHLDLNWRPMKKHETVLVFCQEKMPFYNVIKSEGGKYPTTVLDGFSREVGKHPAQKPVKLFKKLIETFTPENGLVLDTCAGCCVAAFAAIESKRNFIVMELLPEYARTAFRELKEKYSGKKE
jgi:site-specific DNA-methyltransferase (adenine-specific)